MAGDIAELSNMACTPVSQTLKDLKAEIQAYLDWAEPKVAEGAGQLTLFSTVNLHIFPDLLRRPASSADMTSWIYGDYDLVKQFIEGGQTLKQWLEAQGLHLRRGYPADADRRALVS